MARTVSILAPAFNEEPVIELFVNAVVDELPQGWELLVVDDGSTDRTPDLLRDLSNRHEALRVVTHPSNRGLGAALRTGFAEASGDVTVTVDADMSHPVDLLPALVDAVQESDAVFGSRFVTGGGMQGVPLMRRVISHVGNAALRIIFWSSTRDLTTGLRAYRTDVIRSLPLTSDRFEIQLEITVRLLAAKAQIIEIPLVLTTRTAGESKMRYLALLPRYVRLTLRLFKLRWLPAGDPASDRAVE